MVQVPMVDGSELGKLYPIPQLSNFKNITFLHGFRITF